MSHSKWIRNGFILAGAVNVLGIPFFSKLFTNKYLMTIDPRTFSGISLVAIILWGLAYIAVARQYTRVPMISAVFSIEKFFYSIVWGVWLWKNHGALPGIYSEDVITGFFYSIYGLNDFLFGVFFLYVFIRITKKADGHQASIREV